MTPYAAVDAIERDTLIPSGPGDAFSGYGVIGLPFRSGHVLALLLRASSLGPAYTSIWHRDPVDRWTFYSTVAPDCSCARYFGAQVHRNVVTPINLEWTTPWTLRMRIGLELTWQVTLHSSPMTRLFNTIAPLIPEHVWRMPAMLRGVGLGVDAAFGTGRMNLTGRTPNGHQFVMNPRQLWLIAASTAHVSGHNLGPPGPLEEQAALEDLRLPQRGLFAVTRVRLESNFSGLPAKLRGASAKRSCLAGLEVKNFDRAGMASQREVPQNRSCYLEAPLTQTSLRASAPSGRPRP